MQGGLLVVPASIWLIALGENGAGTAVGFGPKDGSDEIPIKFI